MISRANTPQFVSLHFSVLLHTFKIRVFCSFQVQIKLKKCLNTTAIKLEIMHFLHNAPDSRMYSSKRDNIEGFFIIVKEKEMCVGFSDMFAFNTFFCSNSQKRPITN